MHAIDLGDIRLTQDAHGRHYRSRGRPRLLARAHVLEHEVVFPACRVPGGREDVGMKDGAGVEVVFRGEALPVCEQLGLGRHGGGPVRVELGREAVPVSGGIACAARIGVVLEMIF